MKEQLSAQSDFDFFDFNWFKNDWVVTSKRASGYSPNRLAR